MVESNGLNGKLNARLTIDYDPDVLTGYGFDEGTLKMLARNSQKCEWAPLDKSEAAHGEIGLERRLAN